MFRVLQSKTFFLKIQVKKQSEKELRHLNECNAITYIMRQLIHDANLKVVSISK